MEAENQGGQKTLVAFISGLLIGGLVMMVFTAGPKKNATPEVSKNDTAATAPANTDATDAPKTDTPAVVAPTPAPKAEVAVGTGSITLGAEKAGRVVTLGAITFPATDGWIAVQVMNGETLGATLGASRFETKVGLIPKSVELVAGQLVAGHTYAVVFHASNGDHMYSSKLDTVMNGADGKFLGTTFTAK